MLRKTIKLYLRLYLWYIPLSIFGFFSGLLMLIDFFWCDRFDCQYQTDRELRRLAELGEKCMTQSKKSIQHFSDSIDDRSDFRVYIMTEIYMICCWKCFIVYSMQRLVLDYSTPDSVHLIRIVYTFRRQNNSILFWFRA